MDLQLKNRAIFVTGGSRGIGKSIVVNLLKEGVYVSTCSRNYKELNEFKNSLPVALSANLLVFECDVQNKNSICDVVDDTTRAFGRLDGIVANAGYGVSGSLFETPYNDWNSQYQIKISSILNLADAALPSLKKSDAARIIIINGVTANFPDKQMAAVSAARAAVKQISFLLANELFKFHICVNSINIGAIETKRQYVRYEESGSPLNYNSWAIMEANRRGIPFGRFGTPEEVSPIALLLLSPLSSYITASSIDVAGGLNARP